MFFGEKKDFRKGKKRTFARLVNGLITPQTTISIALFCNMNKYILLYLTIYVLKY